MIFKRLSDFSLVLTSAATFLFGAIAQGDDFSGTISRSAQNVFLHCNSGCTNKVEVRALTADSQKTLDRLQNSDFLEGTGGLINGSIVLDSVDFVGLANLLGTWRSGRYWVEFHSFTKATVYLANEVWFDKPASLQYSIVPGDKGNWRVLFSTSVAVNSANLILNGNTMKLQMFDQVTGHSQTYSFVKFNSLVAHAPAAND